MTAEGLLNEWRRDTHHKARYRRQDTLSAAVLSTLHPTTITPKRKIHLLLRGGDELSALFPPTSPIQSEKEVAPIEGVMMSFFYCYLLPIFQKFLETLTASRKLSGSDLGDSCSPWLCPF